MGTLEVQNIIKVKHQDQAVVEDAGVFGEVLLDLGPRDFGREGGYFVWLTPKQARKIAKALRKSAAKVEANRVLEDVNRSFNR